MSESIGFSGLPPLLKRRKRFILLSGLAFAGLAFGVSKMLPQHYSSEGDLLVASHETSMMADVDGAVITQVDVVRSKQLIERVVHNLSATDAANLMPKPRLPDFLVEWLALTTAEINHLRRVVLDEAPPPPTTLNEIEEARVEYIQKYLKVAATEHSSVIALRFSAGSAATAANVINQIMTAYLANDLTAKNNQLQAVDDSLSAHAAQMQRDANAAEAQVEAFIAAHNLPEVQGSSTNALALSRVQDQLALARDKLARDQAALDTLQSGGAASASETLESRTIQQLKEREALLIQQIGVLTSIDPRRQPLESALSTIRSQIAAETHNIVTALARDTNIARANVRSLEAMEAQLATQTQNSSVAAQTLVALRTTAQAKRQLYTDFMSRAEQTRLVAAEVTSARVQYEAVPPLLPDHTSSTLSLLLGFLGGSLEACAWVVMRGVMNKKIHSALDMAAMTGLPVFGCLPEVKPAALMKLTSPDANPIFAETLRAVWLTLRSAATNPTEAITVMVTSSEVGEGKTTVAAALACRVAADGYRVLLVDADLRRPRLAHCLNLNSRPKASLETLMAGTVTSDKAMVTDPATGLHCLFADGRSANPIKILSSEQFESLMQATKWTYDLVIMDTPPVLRVADAVLLGKLAHHILFVVEAGRLKGEVVNEAIRRFTERDRSKIFTLLMRAKREEMNQQDFYGGYDGQLLRLT
jgi:capsular exopolysaccharide synthesis family protein